MSREPRAFPLPRRFIGWATVPEFALMDPSASVRVRSVGRRLEGLFGRTTASVRNHLLETSFVVFAVVFSALLRFEDSNNLEVFLRASSFLVVGRDPYALLPLPAPPGLFFPILPGFATYVGSGYSLAAANFTLKIENLIAILVLSTATARIAAWRNLLPQSISTVRVALLLSPLAFFVSFVWVEQDVVAIAIALLGLLAILRADRSGAARWEEPVGFGLVAFAAFMYYFPVALLPTLVLFSRSASQAARRLLAIVLTLGGFAIWFLFFPGWNFATNAVGVTGANGSISVYSILTLIGNGLFAPATSLQTQVVAGLVVVLIGAELALPILFRWKRVSLEVSLAVAIALPFLLLNIENADEFLWPLPFLLLASLAARPNGVRAIWVWLVQAYAIPVIFVANLWDAPGPGAGSGIFYWGFAQFGNAVTVSAYIPHAVLATQVADLLTWLALLSLLIGLIRLNRVSSRKSSSERPGVAEWRRWKPDPTISYEDERGADGRWRGPGRRGRNRSRWVAVALFVVVGVTLASLQFPSPTLRAGNSDQFPVGFFTAYSVANASVTYSIVPGQNAVSIAPNYGDSSSLATPWQTVGFSRNIDGETVAMDLAVTVDTPPARPYNTTIFSYGSTGLNVVLPFDPPVPSSLMTPRMVANVTRAPALTSVQFVGQLTGGLVFNGSSFGVFDPTPISLPDGQLTFLFRWSGVALPENVVMTLYRGNVTYQVYGQNDTIIAGVKPSPDEPWSWSTPRLVNPLSWHELTATNSTNGTDLTLDGIPFTLPTVPVSREGQGANLVVGAADESPAHFQKFDFWGTIAGPFNTTGYAEELGPPQWCQVGVAGSLTVPPLCSPGLSGDVQVRSTPEGTVSLRTPGGLYQWNRSSPDLEFGRLSLVGPSLVFRLQSISISGSDHLFPLAWAVDGVLVAPLALLLLMRRRPLSGPGGER